MPNVLYVPGFSKACEILMLYFSSCDPDTALHNTDSYFRTCSSHVSCRHQRSLCAANSYRPHIIKWYFPVEACKIDYFAYNRLLILYNLTKQKNSNWVFYFWNLVVSHLVVKRLGTGNTHWGSDGNAGHIWGTSEFIQAPERQSGAGVKCRGCSSKSPPAHLRCWLITDFSHFSSTGFVTWGTYWKFWRAQIWNRSLIFSLILKVSALCFLKWFFPLLWYWSHEFISKALSALELLSLFTPTYHLHYVPPSGKKEIKSSTRASALFHQPASFTVGGCRISIRAELQQCPPSSLNIKQWGSAPV